MAALTLSQLREQAESDRLIVSGRWHEYQDVRRRAADPKSVAQALKEAGVPASSANLLADRLETALRPVLIAATDYQRGLREFVATMDAIELSLKRAADVTPSGFRID